MARTHFGDDESPKVYNDNDMVGDSGWTLAQIVQDIQQLANYFGAPRVIDVMAEYDLTMPESLMVMRKALRSPEPITTVCDYCGGDGYDPGWPIKDQPLHCPRCGGSGQYRA